MSKGFHLPWKSASTNASEVYVSFQNPPFNGVYFSGLLHFVIFILKVRFRVSFHHSLPSLFRLLPQDAFFCWFRSPLFHHVSNLLFIQLIARFRFISGFVPTCTSPITAFSPFYIFSAIYMGYPNPFFDLPFTTALLSSSFVIFTIL